MIYIFGDCKLDVRRYELYRSGVMVSLGPKVFEVLLYLIRHRDQVVTKQALLEAIWPELFVSDAALMRCVAVARKAIGDDAGTRQMIKTHYGRGYRFTADVEERVSSPPAKDVPFASEVTYIAERTTEDQPDRLCSTQLTDTHLSVDNDLPEEERKYVTLISCTLAQASALAVRLSPEAMNHLMHRFFNLAWREVQRYGGSLESFTDHGFMALFGVPLSREDHARQALVTAVALQRKVSDQRAVLGVPTEARLELCIGVHTGYVVGRQIGDSSRPTYLAIGDTMRLATQLQAHAEPAAIVLSEATARLLRGGARIAAYGAIPTTTSTRPIMTYRLLEIEPQSSLVGSHRNRPLTRLVGRRRELSTLHDLLTQSSAGRGCVVGVMGEPGLGKSRLVYEFRRSLLGKPVTYLTGQCAPYGHATAYLPVLDALQHYCGISRVDDTKAVTATLCRRLQEAGMASDEWADYLLYVLGHEVPTEVIANLSPQALKRRIFDALLGLLINSSRQRPLVLEIENVHWIDPTSEAFLTSLVEHLVGVPILLVVTYRPGYRPPWVEKSYVTQLSLTPLLPDDSQRMIRTILEPQPISASLVQQIVLKARGNPFFLEELTQTAGEAGDQETTLIIPDTVQVVLTDRIDRLPAEAKRLLQIAAVIGNEVPYDLLRAIADYPDEALQTALAHLQAREFLYPTAFAPDSAYTFKHALTQDVAYQSLLSTTRRHFHQRIAQALIENFPATVAAEPERLARHYTEAGLYEQAISYWQRAGQLAIERSAHVEATVHLTKGLEMLTSVPRTSVRLQQELMLQQALGVSLQATKGFAAPEVEQIYKRAWELCQQVGETQQLFSVLRGFRLYYTTRGEIRKARELAEQLLCHAQQQREVALIMEAHWVLGAAVFWFGEFALACNHFEQGMALHRVQGHHVRPLLRESDPRLACLSFWGRSLWALGYPQQARERIQESLTLARQRAHPLSLAWTLSSAAFLYMYLWDTNTVRNLAETLIALSKEQRFVQWEAFGTMFRGWALAMQGFGHQGRYELHQGLTAFRDTGAEVTLSHWLAMLAEACGVTGHATEGVDILNGSLKWVNRTGIRYHKAALYLLKGELLLKRTVVDEDAAETCFHQALNVARHQEAKSWELRAAMSLARLWQRQDRRQQARDLLASVYDWFTEGFDTVDLQEAEALLDDLS